MLKFDSHWFFSFQTMDVVYDMSDSVLFYSMPICSPWKIFYLIISRYTATVDVTKKLMSCFYMVCVTFDMLNTVSI